MTSGGDLSPYCAARDRRVVLDRKDSFMTTEVLL